MINFAVPEQKVNEDANRIKRMVLMVTTVVLVVFVVGSAATAGWWWYWAGKEDKTSQEYLTLSEEVRKLANEEVMARKLDYRAKVVSQFLDSRGKVGVMAASLEYPGVKIVGWEYDGAVSQVVEAASGSKDTLMDYSKVLATKYQTVSFDGVEWKPTTGWVATIILGGAPR